MNRMILQQEIPRRKQTCFVGQEAFETGMEYYSLINEDDAGKWIRRDFCLDCWEKWKTENLTPHDSHWKSRVQAEKKKMPLDHNEKALELLREALQKSCTEDQQEAFILALYLARNKKLALRSQDERWMVYEVLDTEEVLLVPKLNPAALPVEKIQASLTVKLGTKGI